MLTSVTDFHSNETLRLGSFNAKKPFHTYLPAKWEVFINNY